MTVDNLTRMADASADAIVHRFKLRLAETGLVGNGSSWSNHIPVLLHARRHKPDPRLLELILPAALLSTGRFHGGPCAGTLNGSHRHTHERLGYSLATQLAAAQKAGTPVEVYPGWHARNRAFTARCTHLILYTLCRWDESWEREMYRRFNGPKIHIVIKDILDT